MIEVALGLKLLIAIFQAIPSLKEWFDQLVVSYLNLQIENMKSEHKDAIKKAIDSRDQRPIEQVINPDYAGKPSVTPGAEIFPHRERH